MAVITAGVLACGSENSSGRAELPPSPPDPVEPFLVAGEAATTSWFAATHAQGQWVVAYEGLDGRVNLVFRDEDGSAAGQPPVLLGGGSPASLVPTEGGLDLVYRFQPDDLSSSLLVRSLSDTGAPLGSPIEIAKVLNPGRCSFHLSRPVAAPLGAETLVTWWFGRTGYLCESEIQRIMRADVGSDPMGKPVAEVSQLDTPWWMSPHQTRVPTSPPEIASDGGTALVVWASAMEGFDGMKGAPSLDGRPITPRFTGEQDFLEPWNGGTEVRLQFRLTADVGGFLLVESVANRDDVDGSVRLVASRRSTDGSRRGEPIVVAESGESAVVRQILGLAAADGVSLLLWSESESASAGTDVVRASRIESGVPGTPFTLEGVTPDLVVAASPSDFLVVSLRVLDSERGELRGVLLPARP